MRIISAGGAPLQWRVMPRGQGNPPLKADVGLLRPEEVRAPYEKIAPLGGARSAMTVLTLAAALATPALAMDDQATYWRFDGRVEKRLTSVAPATEWATSAWIGDDRRSSGCRTRA